MIADCGVILLVHESCCHVMVVYFYQVDSAAIIQKMWPRYVPVDIDLCLCASCVNSLELCTV